MGFVTLVCTVIVTKLTAETQQRVNCCSRQNHMLIYIETCYRIIPTQLKMVGYCMTTDNTLMNHSRNLRKFQFK